MNINSSFKPSYQSPEKGDMFQYTRGTEVYLMCEVGHSGVPSRFVQLTGCGAGTIHRCVMTGRDLQIVTQKHDWHVEVS